MKGARHAIHIPRPLAILLLTLIGGAIVGMLIREAADLWRYAKVEGM
jgi:hypothetical protein